MNCLGTRLTTRFKKIIVIWLLALTAPVHGLAATLMPLMQATLPSVIEASMPVHSAVVDHAHMHHHADHSAAADAGHAPDQSHDMKHCASCGACCMPALMVAPGDWPAVHPQSLIAVEFSSPFFPGPTPDRLDRPPRPSFV